jgi:hypothetical protein
MFHRCGGAPAPVKHFPELTMFHRCPGGIRFTGGYLEGFPKCFTGGRPATGETEKCFTGSLMGVLCSMDGAALLLVSPLIAGSTKMFHRVADGGYDVSPGRRSPIWRRETRKCFTGGGAAGNVSPWRRWTKFFTGAEMGQRAAMEV